MSPGGYFFAGLAIIFAGIACGYLVDWVIPFVTTLFGGLIMTMGKCGTGYREPTTGCQGSVCPNCGAANKIRIWDL